VEECAAYSCGRADAALRLCELFEPELEERGQLEYLLGLELPLASVLADMELAGIRVDTDALAKLSRDLDRRLRSLEAEMHELAGYEFNPKSSSQLGKLLYENLGLEGTRKTARGYSTDVYALEALAGSHPIVEKLLTYRRLSKLKDTYVDTLPQLVNPRTGRVHTSFSQTATSTGRLSSSDPNLQNIPVRTPEGRKVRRAFVAGDAGAVLLSADYSQIELRVLAHVSGERRLVDAFARGDDVHALTAADLYGVSPGAVTPEMRRVGKAVNYGVIYGMTGYRLARDTGLERREATEFVKRHSKLYPAIRAYFEETLRSAEEKGYVETPLGRRRYLPDLRASDRQRRQAARRAAENMPNQGMTADIIKRAMIEVHARLRERGLRARMLLQVHDELLLEAPEAELEEVAELVTREMRWAAKLDVPLEVEAKYGPNWADMRPLGGGTDGETP
jgi:DNA polymerase-1